jgi:hypothetical protein
MTVPDVGAGIVSSPEREAAGAPVEREPSRPQAAPLVNAVETRSRSWLWGVLLVALLVLLVLLNLR